MSRAFGLRHNRDSHISLQSGFKACLPRCSFSCPQQKNLRQLCTVQARNKLLHARTEHSPEPGGLILAIAADPLPTDASSRQPLAQSACCVKVKKEAGYTARSIGMCTDPSRRAGSRSLLSFQCSPQLTASHKLQSSTCINVKIAKNIFPSFPRDEQIPSWVVNEIYCKHRNCYRYVTERKPNKCILYNADCFFKVTAGECTWSGDVLMWGAVNYHVPQTANA